MTETISQRANLGVWLGGSLLAAVAMIYEGYARNFFRIEFFDQAIAIDAVLGAFLLLSFQGRPRLRLISDHRNAAALLFCILVSLVFSWNAILNAGTLPNGQLAYINYGYSSLLATLFSTGLVFAYLGLAFLYTVRVPQK